MFAECMRGIFVYRIRYSNLLFVVHSAAAAVQRNKWQFIHRACSCTRLCKLCKAFFKRCTLARFECVCVCII